MLTCHVTELGKRLDGQVLVLEGTQQLVGLLQQHLVVVADVGGQRRRPTLGRRRLLSNQSVRLHDTSQTPPRGNMGDSITTRA